MGELEMQLGTEARGESQGCQGQSRVRTWSRYKSRLGRSRYGLDGSRSRNWSRHKSRLGVAAGTLYRKQDQAQLLSGMH